MPLSLDQDSKAEEPEKAGEKTPAAEEDGEEKPEEEGPKETDETSVKQAGAEAPPEGEGKEYIAKVSRVPNSLHEPT